LLMVYCACAAEKGNSMKITLLGTGTPFPNAERFGPAILVEAGSKKLLFDCGRGIVIRLAQAKVNPEEIEGIYLTHLHADHVTGIPDLWLTGWFLGRKDSLRIWGPHGTRHMAHHLVEAFRFDVQTRIMTEALPAKGAELDTREISQGKVYDDGSVRVSAFTVDHGAVKPAFGYRVDYAGHSVVISGDTKFSQNLIDFAKSTDCLIHAAWAVGTTNPTPPSLRSIASAEDAGRVFAIVNPRIAVVYHYKEEEGLEAALRSKYGGPFVVAKDLMTIVIDRTIKWSNGTQTGTQE
jgi:ribonuclease Z